MAERAVWADGVGAKEAQPPRTSTEVGIAYAGAQARTRGKNLHAMGNSMEVRGGCHFYTNPRAMGTVATVRVSRRSIIAFSESSQGREWRGRRPSNGETPTIASVASGIARAPFGSTAKPARV